MALTIIGTAWSDDIHSSLHFIGKLVYWLIIPIIIGLSYYSPKIFTYAFFSVSAGLFLHLIVCTLQYNNLLIIPDTGVGGTSATDPAGFLGHLNFGFIYAIWVGLLLVISQKLSITLKLIVYIIVIYATTSIFLTQGRGGYIIALTLLLLVVWKIYFNIKLWHGIFMMIFILTSAISLLTINQHTQTKINSTLAGVESFVSGDLSKANARLKIWLVTFDLYKEGPFIGIGTGDFKQDFLEKTKTPKYSSNNIDAYDNPHNEFLFSLVRWGPIGLVALLFLLIAWIQSGLKADWQNQPIHAYLLSASGIAILINSFSDSSLSGYSSTIFAILVLAFAIGIKPPQYKQ